VIWGEFATGFLTGIDVYGMLRGVSGNQNSYQSLMPLRGTWNDENWA
jgi:hypothetical protein